MVQPSSLVEVEPRPPLVVLALEPGLASMKAMELEASMVLVAGLALEQALAFAEEEEEVALS